MIYRRWDGQQGRPLFLPGFFSPPRILKGVYAPFDGDGRVSLLLLLGRKDESPVPKSRWMPQCWTEDQKVLLESYAVGLKVPL